MLECFLDFVGLKGCGSVTPPSGVYVNSVPGITTYLASFLANREQITARGLWADVQQQAISKLSTDLIRGFQTVHKQRLKQIPFSVDLGRRLDGTFVADATERRGVTIELRFPSVVYSLSSYFQVIFVQKLALYSTAEHASFEVKFHNIDSLELLMTKTVDLVVGWNEIYVGSSFNATRLMITYNAEGFVSSSMNLPQSALNNCQACVDCVFGEGECEAIIRGVTTPTDLSSINYTENSYGISFVASVQCRYDNLICNNKEVFVYVWQKLLAATILDFGGSTERVNHFTTVGKEGAAEDKEKLLMQYDTDLKTAIEGLKIDAHDCCVECVSRIQTPYIIP